jgi:hypothetical protein
MASRSTLAKRAKSRLVNRQYFLTEIWREQGSAGMLLKAPKPDASQPSHSGNEVMIATK